MDGWLKRIILLIVLFLILIPGIKYFFIYFSPFIIAAILASLINPLEVKIEEYFPIKRGLAVFIVLLLLLSMFVLFLVFGLSQIYLELNHLLNILPDYNTLGQQLHWIVQQNNRLQEIIDGLDLSPALNKILNDNLQSLYTSIKDGLILLINNLLNILTKLPLIVTILVLSFIATFFISRDRDEINRYIMSCFPQHWKPKVFKMEKELVTSAIRFIMAELVLISITGLISFLGLVLIGSPYSVIIAIAAALLDLIPIIGPGLIFIPWIIYNVLIGKTTFGFSLLLVFTLMAAIREGAEGKVMGSNLGFHPLLIMMALYVGFRIMGPLGFVVGPSVLILFRAIINSGLIPDYKMKK